MMLVLSQTNKENSMTHINFTLELEQVQELIKNSGANDLAKQMLTTLFNQLMEKQRDEYVQVDDYVRDKERQSQRNGYYDRSYTTRIGTLELVVPRTRDGQFSPTLFERYQRHEKALLTTMLEMNVQGVSTRKVSHVVETLCGRQLSKSFVSSLTVQLDEAVNAFLEKKFEINYPFIFSDVLYIKVRDNHRVLSKAFHLVVGVNALGEREILGFSIDNSESYDSWKTLYNSLIKRGLKGVKMITSDAHKGEVQAIKECFGGATWQRCQVHFMRNVFDKLPKRNTEAIRIELKALFKLTSIEAARAYKNQIVDRYVDKYPNMVTVLDEGFEDAFAYCGSGETNYNRLKSTNMLERLNQEIRRREKVVRIFPNDASTLRLIGSILLDIHDRWISSNRQYIRFSQKTIQWIQ